MTETVPTRPFDDVGALAWLRSRPGIAAPIASARTPEQLPDLLAGARLELAADEVQALTDASA